MRFFGLNLGGFNDGGVPGYPRGRDPATPKLEDVDGVGPDARHPFVIRDYRAWDTHWAFHAGSRASGPRGWTCTTRSTASGGA